MIIAIDGMSGTGKSTLSHKLASHYGWMHINSGLFYRLSGYIFKQSNDSISSSELMQEGIQTIIDLLRDGSIQIRPMDDGIIFQGSYHKDDLYDENLTHISAVLSKDLNLRRAINEFIDHVIAEKNAIVEGRDSAKNIVPQADLKILLVTNPEVRHRRLIESRNLSGTDHTQVTLTSIDQINAQVSQNLADISLYDIVYDTSEKTLEQTFRIVCELIDAQIDIAGDHSCH